MRVMNAIRTEDVVDMAAQKIVTEFVPDAEAAKPFARNVRGVGDYGNIGAVHLFMAAPAGLAMLVGQSLNTFGAVHTYEHVSTDGSGRYRRAALLRPCA
jgi:hypothetical protein